jgi:uncharacterized membrane protein
VDFDFPFTESIIIYIGVGIILVGFFLVTFLFYQVVNRPHRKKEKDAKKPTGVLKNIGKVFTLIFKAFRGPATNKDGEKTPPGCLYQMFRLVFIALLIALGLAILFFGAFIQSLSTFNKQQMVAEVLCKEIDKTNHAMKIILIEKKGRNADVEQEFLLTGDRWFIRGDIIKWDNWLNFLGLHTMYKLNRIGGFFPNTRMETELKPTHYSLIPEEETPKWRWLYKKGYELPFINNVYGSSVSQYPELQKVFKIYVTIFGFSIGPPEEVGYR